MHALEFVSSDAEDNHEWKQIIIIGCTELLAGGVTVFHTSFNAKPQPSRRDSRNFKITFILKRLYRCIAQDRITFGERLTSKFNRALAALQSNLILPEVGYHKNTTNELGFKVMLLKTIFGENFQCNKCYTKTDTWNGLYRLLTWRDLQPLHGGIYLRSFFKEIWSWCNILAFNDFFFTCWINFASQEQNFPATKLIHLRNGEITVSRGMMSGCSPIL